MEKVRGVYLNKRTLGMILLGIALTATLLVGFFGIRYEDQLEQACHVLLVLTLAAVLSALLVICARPKIRPENLFLLLVILFGLLFMVAITPLAVPDEYHHYLSTLSQTSKMLYGKCQADAAYLNVDDISIHNISYETFQNMLNGLFNEGISGQIKTFDDEAAGYPVQYAPQMVGMGLAMLLHLNRYWVFLLGDFTNLLFYAAVTYAAIRRIPVGKVPMMIVALLPMSMQQASSYSSDAFINAMAFLLVAEMMRAIVGKGKLPWQSMLAIGSGGVFGLGLGNGRQKFLYLPEPQNDFIFAVVCEELGLVGACLVLLLFALLIIRGYWLALNARDRFGSLVIVGITTLFAFQVFANVAVVTSLFPVTGISLPFFSYGGSALIIQLAEMGLILSISRQNPAS